MARRERSGSNGIFTFRRMVAALGLIALAIFLAPIIIAKTPLRQQLVSFAAPELKAEVEIGSANFWWFSPITLSNTKVRDEKGEPLLSFTELSIEKSLLSLILDSSDIGKVKIVEPQAFIALRDDGSNIEDLIEPFMTSESESTESIPLQVEIENGSVNLATSTGSWALNKLNASFDMPGQAERPILVNLDCVVADLNAPEGAIPGSIEGAFSWKLPADETSLGQGEARFACFGLPLEIVGPLARRAGVDLQTAGTLDADARIVAEANGHLVELNQVTARNIRVRAPEYLKDEELQLAQIVAKGTAHQMGTRLELDAFRIESPIASVAAQGGMDIGEFSTQRLLDTLQNENYEMQAQADLAALAKLLPATFRIREGAEIQSGIARMRVASRVEGGRRRFVADAETENIQAIRQGQLLQWSQPIRLNVAANLTPNGPIVETMTVDSTFLKLSGSGDLNQGKATITGDLDRLASELGKFVDLSDYQLAGQMQGDLGWQIQQQQQIAAAAKLTLTKFALTLPESKPWYEESLVAEASAQLLAGTASVERLETATARLQSGEDTAEVVLLAPVVKPGIDSEYSIRAKLNGRTETWLPRIQNWAPVDEIDLAGLINAEVTGRVSTALANIENSRIELTNCHGSAYGLTFDEPRLLLEGVGAWNQTESVFASENITLASSTVSLRGTNVRVAAEDLAMSGDLAYRCDLNRIMLMMSDRKTPPTQRVEGEASGVVSLTHKEGVTSTNANADLKDLRISMLKTVDTPGVFAVSHRSEWEPVWVEPVAKMTFQGQYSGSNDRLQIFQADLASQAVSATVAGDLLHAASAAPDVDIKGKVSYDLARIVERFRTTVGDDVQVVGRGVRDFYLQGPVFPEIDSAGAATKLVSENLKGGASVAWQGADVYGLVFGDGLAEAKLENGVIELLPIQAAVSEGRFNMGARLPLNQQPLTIHAGTARVIDNVRLSPQMCRTWMKFLAPLVADATAAEGRFSVTLKQLKTPVLDPYASNVQGVLHVGAGQVGPGPLGSQILGAAGQINALLAGKPLGGVLNTASGSWLGLPQQDVAFDVSNNAVRHENLRIISGDVAVATSGAVGFDQSLDMVAVASLREGARQGQPIADAFRTVKVSLPIRGTASKPQVDTSGMGKLATQLAAAALKNNVIQDNINNVLNPAGIKPDDITKKADEIKNKADDLKNKAGKAINDQLNRGFNSIFGR